VARAIHYSGERGEKRFVSVSCAALTETLLESECSAMRRAPSPEPRPNERQVRAGRRWNHLLDELADISPKLQADLLRVLQERRFYRVGGHRRGQRGRAGDRGDHKNWRMKSNRGDSATILYYRLNVIEIRIPPLRERREDIPLLAEHFVERIASNWEKTSRGSPAARLSCSLSTDWPGNVRELENVIERAIVTSHNGTLVEGDLPGSTSAAARTELGGSRRSVGGDGTPGHPGRDGTKTWQCQGRGRRPRDRPLDPLRQAQAL